MSLCKICNNLGIPIEDVKKNLRYYRCTSCGFVWLDNQFMLNVIEEKKKYNQHNNSLENKGYVQMFEDFIEMAIVPYKQNIHSILDFGSGPVPVLSQLLERRGFKVDIYDLYYAPTKIYENKTYDLISSTEVFEHLSKPLEILSLLAKHLNQHGYLALMTKFPPKDDAEFLAWWYRRDPTHISFFTTQSFEVMGKKIGLKVLKTINENVVIFQKK